MKNINSFWGYLLIDELVRNDISYFCISPGSRSTPLTIAAAENNNAEKFICIDERAAAFHALGYARATGKPAVVISTSGTAVANFYPAILEAKNSQIPLILLSADRPPELRDTGANQTNDQVKMFGNNINWQFDLPCPDPNIPANMVLTTVDQAVHRAINPRSGPVHINCMFREPLEPTEDPLPHNYTTSVSNWEKSNHPFTEYKAGIRVIGDDLLKELAQLLNNVKNGWFVVGQIASEVEKMNIVKLAVKLRWPVFADITSGIKNKTELGMLVPYFDQMLLSKKIISDLTPEVILHFGRALTSRRYLKTIENLDLSDYIQIESGDARFDPAHLVTQRICGDVSSICQKIFEQIETKSDQKIEPFILDSNIKIEKIVEQYCAPEKSISEISTAHLLSKHLSKSVGLFLASSMPVRDFDIYGGSEIKTSHISSNRGSSGIDGTLASAVGFANGLKKPVTVVIGDLAMIHDLNSLSQVHNSEFPITIVLINNGGGGIFSFLPVAAFENVFDQYFATPHSYHFDQIAKMFGIEYINPSTNQELIYLINKSNEDNLSKILEIKTDRKENFNLHQDIQKEIITSLEK